MPRIFPGTFSPVTLRLDHKEKQKYDSLKVLTVRRLPVRMALPRSLQQLTFEDSFNSKLELFSALPSGLQHLRFGAQFNQSIGLVVLPSSLQTLTFGKRFIREVKNAATLNFTRSDFFDGDLVHHLTEPKSIHFPCLNTDAKTFFIDF